MALEQAKRIVHSVPLPTEIIIEILLWLPVESLLRCKSVCKLWLTLISDPYFIKSHLKLSSTTHARHRLIYYTDSLEINLKSCPLSDVLFEKSLVNSLDHDCLYPLQPPYSFPKIAGSCNGLVCFYDLFRLKGDTGIDLFICNPCTKLSTRLYSTFDMPSPVRRFEVYGFAYHKATDDYKIVEISRPCDLYQAMNQNSKVKIYSLKTAKWKQIGDFPHGYPENIMPDVFSNGYLHWMTTPTPTDYNDLTYSCTIVSLDLANETYAEVSQPAYDEGRKVLTLGVLREWLCVLCNYHVTRADVWVMKAYGVQDSWTKLVSISYPVNLHPPNYRPLFIANDGTILLQSGWNLVVYDSNDGSCFKLENIGRGCVDATTFVESLVSPYPPNNNKNK